jgi:ribonuclease HI
MVTLYTDGGCTPNPGKGAWACVVVAGDNIFTSSGFIDWATSNSAEMLAVINGVKFLKTLGIYKPGVELEIVSDSRYVVMGASTWMEKWKKTGWVTTFRSKNENVKNKELWQEIDQINVECKPVWKWIRGHSGIMYNEMCDKMCKDVMKKY